jgi:hypothetical protein
LQLWCFFFGAVYALAVNTKPCYRVPLAAVFSVGIMGFLIGPPLIRFISEASSLLGFLSNGDDRRALMMRRRVVTNQESHS